MTTPPDLSVIKAAAEAAAKRGDPNWTYETHHQVWFGGDEHSYAVCKPYGDGTFGGMDDIGRYIALMSPSTTEALIARVEAAEGERDEARAKEAEITGWYESAAKVASEFAQEKKAAEARVEKLEGALKQAADAISEYHRYQHGGDGKYGGSYDGKPERANLWKAGAHARETLAVFSREALTPTGGQNGA